MPHKLELTGIERFNDWFQTRVKNGCPFCDGRDWTVHDEMSLMPTVDGGTHEIDTAHGAPVVQITCNVCAFTASFSATRIGVVIADPD
jgi:hypothetical protein